MSTTTSTRVSEEPWEFFASLQRGLADVAAGRITRRDDPLEEEDED